MNPVQILVATFLAFHLVACSEPPLRTTGAVALLLAAAAMVDVWGRWRPVRPGAGASFLAAAGLLVVAALVLGLTGCLPPEGTDDEQLTCQAEADEWVQAVADPGVCWRMWGPRCGVEDDGVEAVSCAPSPDFGHIPSQEECLAYAETVVAYNWCNLVRCNDEPRVEVCYCDPTYLARNPSRPIPRESACPAP